MERVKIYLILIATIMFVGCDPAFEHEFKGKIVNKRKNEPIENVKLEYSFYPIENLNHWRANVEEIDSIKLSDKSGEFEIKFSTITMTFDSLKIRINKEGYKEKTLVSPNEDWKSGFGLNMRKFRFNFGEIELEKKEN